MFLNRLNQDEKTAFLKLAYIVCISDENFMEMQKVILDEYCKEMGIENFIKDDYKVEEKIDDILNVFTKEHIKIVFLELMPLIFADDVLHEEEKKILDKVKDKFNKSDEYLNLVIEWSKAIKALYSQAEVLLRYDI